MMNALTDSDEKIEAEPYDIHLFHVPFEAIRSVIIGARATHGTVKEIEAALAENPELS